MKFFISFCKGGKRFAKKLKLVIESEKSCNHEVFMSDISLRAGDRSWAKILKELRSADIRIFIVTEHSEGSFGQGYEYEAAMKCETYPVSFIKTGVVHRLDNLWGLTVPQYVSFTNLNVNKKFRGFSSDLNSGIYSRSAKPAKFYPEKKKIKTKRWRK